MRHFSERPRAATLGLLFLFASLELWFRSPVLLGTLALYQRDLFLLYFPLVQSALRGLSEGALPLRDPSSAFGQPLLGDPSCQILYPPVLLHFFLPPHLAYAWFVSIHSVFGALGVALLARRISGGSWLAALVGGLAWLVSGPLQSLATLWHHMAGAAWIPWVLVCVLRVGAGNGGRSAVVLGAVFGAQVLAGSADMSAMTLLVAGLLVTPSGYRRHWKSWLVSAMVALTMSAGVWLPAADIVANSARSALPEATRTFWSLHPLSALEFFLPVPLSAFPLLPEWRTALFEGREPFLGSMFIGTTILPLCLAALADPRIPRATRAACFLGVSGGFLISLGKHAAAYSMAVALIPPLGILRFPSKGMIPVAILMCVLAGAGASSIERSPRSRRVALIGIVAVATAALAFLGPLLEGFVKTFLDAHQTLPMIEVWRNLPLDLLVSVSLLGGLAATIRWPSGKTGLLLVAALAAGHVRQSVYLHTDFNPTVALNILAYKPPHVELIRPPAGSRVYVYDYGLFEGRARKYLGRDTAWDVRGLGGFSPHAASVVASRAYLTPLTGAFWGVDYAWDADLRLLFDRRLSQLTTGLRRVEGTPGFLKLLQISGVERVASLHEAGMNGLKLLYRQNVFQAEDLRIFEVPDPLPRAFLATGRRRTSGSDLADLLNPQFDPRTTVLVDGGPVTQPVPGFAGNASILERRADRILIETATSHPAFLGALEGVLPGWRAWVDGKPAQVERANAIFVGTQIPAGTHRVEFRFLPTSAVVGAISTALTILFLLSVFARGGPSTDGAAEGMLGRAGEPLSP